MHLTKVYLSPDVSLKRLESLYVYNRATDDLYEVSEDAFAFLQLCAGGAPGEQADDEFLSACLSEGVLELTPATRERRTGEASVELPSLRYLLVHLTWRCDLSCKHCLHGESHAEDLSVFSLRRMLEEFEAMGGLRLLLSGGEPLQYPHFWQLNDVLPSYDLRAVLMTNGALLTPAAARRLHVQEVQVSLDGLERSHDAVRGAGSFRAALAGLTAAREAGLTVSVASTVNALNLDEFDDLALTVGEFDPWQWTIEVPVVSGRLAQHPELQVDLPRAARALDLAMPAAGHADEAGWLCGAHLAAVLPDGSVVKCGLLTDVRGGPLDDGLQAAWAALPHDRISTLDATCRSCAYLDECRGGCRFRARGGGPDPVQCRRYGKR
jgi:radical SAM protein with 4Fe4S-binding SPASM domain